MKKPKKCPRCGTEDQDAFYQGKYTCRECLRRQDREYYAANREAVKARKRKWHSVNPTKQKESSRRHYQRNHDKELARIRKWRAENRDKARAAVQQWAKNHPEEIRVRNHIRKAAKQQAGGRASSEQIQHRIAFFGGMCAYCRVEPYAHVDHTIALTAGGTNWPANLRPACAHCNLTKWKKTWCLANFGSPVQGDVPTFFKISSTARSSVAVRKKFDYELFELERIAYWDCVGYNTRLEILLRITRSDRERRFRSVAVSSARAQAYWQEQIRYLDAVREGSE